MHIRNLYHITALIIVLTLSVSLYCQDTEKPVPPRVYYVTVDPATGNVKIVWIRSTSENAHIYIILKAELTGNPSYPPAFIEIGKVPSADSVFIYEDSESQLHSDGYTVQSVDTISGLSDFYQLTDSTVFLDASFDSCSSAINLAWNDYNRWRGNIKEYIIYQKTNEGVLSAIHTLPEETNSLVIENVQANYDYAFYVEVFHNDGIRASTSNMAQVNTKMTRPPAYINADHVSVSANNTIELSFTVDQLSELTRYRLYRSDSAEGPFNIIDSFYRTKKKFVYTDNIDYTSGIYYYRLEAVNNCGQTATYSNTANNILLKGNNNNLTNTLAWNSIADCNGDIDNYALIRITGNASPATDTVYKGSMLFYNDNLDSLLSRQEPSNNYFCYRVEATEINNPYIGDNIFTSNTVCLTVSSDINLPNAFIPNDNINNTFGPIFNFSPEEYRLTIYNSWGLKVWEGSEPWNGEINGSPAPGGYYLYHIKVLYPDKVTIEKNGFVFLFYR
jgi:hypothetical protein